LQEGSAIKGKKAYIELKNTSQGVYFTTKALKALTDEYKDVTR
jgi:DNA mismatch repair protein MSH2